MSAYCLLEKSALAALEEFSPKDTPRGREYRMRAEALKSLASA